MHFTNKTGAMGVVQKLSEKKSIEKPSQKFHLQLSELFS